MKKSEIKLFKPFLNQNGYLSICYRITNNRIHIINWNGSSYNLVLNDNNVNYQSSMISIEEFFEYFPTNKLFQDELVKYKGIKEEFNRYKEYHSQQKEFSTNKSLLIL